MARKSNWKRRGLPAPITTKDRNELRVQREVERRLAQMPSFLRPMAMQLGPGYF